MNTKNIFRFIMLFVYLAFFCLCLWHCSTTIAPVDKEPDTSVPRGTYLPDLDFNTLHAAGNNAPVDLWSDGTNMWVSDVSDGKLYAYHLATTQRNSSQDFDTLSDAGNIAPTGIWSDGTTMWVADNTEGKIYAYKLSDKTRDAAKDFDTLSNVGNTDPFCIWSDGTTMWVVNNVRDIYAYSMSTKNRDTDEEFTLAPNHTSLRGIGSDGTSILVGNANPLFNGFSAYSLSDKTYTPSLEYTILLA